MVNKKLVKQKINLIEEEMLDLEKLAKYSFDQIASDFLKLNIVERILEKIINRALDINQHLIAQLSQGEIKTPLNYRETFLRLADLNVYPQKFAQNILKSIGTKNVLVYDYDKVDYSKIYNSINDCLKDYHQYCDYIIKILNQ